MVNQILSYMLTGSFIICVLLSMILMTRTILLFFGYMKKSEALSKYRNELIYVKTRIRMIERYGNSN